KLVEGIDARQHGVGEGAMLVEGNERAERSRVEPVEKDRRARAIAGVAPLWIIALPALHQRGPLSERIEEQQAVMLRALIILRFADRQELDRHEHRALVK